MLTYLLRNRYRPKLGSVAWFKYWAKRGLLIRELGTQVWIQRRFHRGCRSFGDRNALSDVQALGRMSNLSIGDDCAIGKATIQLHDGVTIGNAVAINDGVNIMTGSHDVHDPSWPLISGPVVIEDHAWLATGSAVLPNVTIGRGAVVGAFAVVSKSVPPLAIVVGNPGRVIGHRKATEFAYCPSKLYALFEAWLGKENIPGRRAHAAVDSSANELPNAASA